MRLPPRVSAADLLARLREEIEHELALAALARGA